MLSSIKIKDIASFDATGSELQDLQPVNFIYGNNGTGKSTIVKYLYSLSHESASSEFTDCSQIGYANDVNQILVFDEKFVERNFLKSNEQSGIFSLDQKNEEIDSLIEAEEEELAKYRYYKDTVLTNRILNIETYKKNEFKDLKDKCFEKRKAIIAPLVKLEGNFPKRKTQNNYDQINLLLSKKNDAEYILKEYLIARYNELYEKELVEVSTNFDSTIYINIRKLERKIYKILSEVIVGKSDVDIATLIEKLGNRKWVEDGFSLIDKDTELQPCPFCQKKTIDSDLISKFEDFFDEAYREKMGDIIRFVTEYHSLAENLKNNLELIAKEFNPNNITTDIIAGLDVILKKNNSVFLDKELHSEKKLSINSINILKNNLSNLIKLIEVNNTDFDNIELNRKELNDNIWISIIQQCKADIDKFNNKESQYKRISLSNERLSIGVQSKIKISREKIEELKGHTVDTGQAVVNINTILKNSGFQGFEINEEKKINNISKYYLKREGESGVEVFHTLSEGEKNFITFLYFYELCNGTDKDENKSKKKIIVIDDPVSSLDSRVLFIVSTLIRKLIERKDNTKPGKKVLRDVNIVQAFIFTHNIYFYKEVSFIKRVICKKLQHYHITKQNKISKITKREYNKIKFNDYDILWEQIYTTSGESNVSLMNNLRRILESYMNFVGKTNVWDSLIDIDEADPKFYIYTALLSQVNDGSHKLSINDEMFYSKVSEEDRETILSVFEDLFSQIGLNHFEAKKSQFSNEQGIL